MISPTTQVPAKIPTKIIIHEINLHMVHKDAVDLLHLKSIDLTTFQCKKIVSTLFGVDVNCSFKATLTKEMTEADWDKFSNAFKWSRADGEEELEEKTLKLFRVTIYVETINIPSVKEYKALILSLDKRGAKAIASLDTPIVPGEEVHRMDVEEVEGPFKNGQTLMIQRAL